LLRFKSTFLRTLLHLEFLLVLSLLAAWVVCMVVPPAMVAQPTGINPHLLRNYRTLRTVIHRISRIDPGAGTPDLDKQLQNLSATEPEREFLQAAIVLEQASALDEREIPARMPGFLRRVPSRDAYLWQAKNRLIYRWLDRSGHYAKMAERHRAHPPDSTALRLRVMKAQARADGVDAAAQLLRELFPRVSLGRLLDGLPRRLQRGLQAALETEDWERRFTFLARRGHWSSLVREIRKCPDQNLNNLLLAANAYRLRRFDSCRLHLGRIQDPRFMHRAAALRIKMDIRAGRRGNIWNRIQALQTDPAVHIGLLQDVAGLSLVDNQLDHALRAYSELVRVTQLKDSRHWKAIWISAWIEMKRGHKRAARKLFRRGSRSPIAAYRIACAFWQHRLGGGRLTEINQAPFTYYFVRGGKNHRQGLAQGLRVFTGHLDAPADMQTLRRLQRALKLAELGLIDQARAYLSWAREAARPGSPDAVLLTLTHALLESRLRRHYHAFVAFRTGLIDYHALRLPRFLGDLLAPLEYSDIIALHSRARGLDPHLVAALIREESMFRPDSRSASNAYGLMQMLPRTYAHLSGKRLTSRLRWQLVQPEVNIRWGTTYLRRLLDKYNGRVYLALAAYNAGDHRVDRWLRQFGQVSEVRFIEMIPFSETRTYVKNILRNHFYYRFYHPDAFQDAAPAREGV